MPFKTAENQELSSKNVSTLAERCLKILYQAALNEHIRKSVILPLLEIYQREPVTEDTQRLSLEGGDAVEIVWAMFKQGALLCQILNWFMPNVVAVDQSYLELLSNPDGDDYTQRLATAVGPNSPNVQNFLDACTSNYIKPEEELFKAEDLVSTHDINCLATVVGVAEELLGNIRYARRDQGDLDTDIESLKQNPECALLFPQNQIIRRGSIGRLSVRSQSSPAAGRGSEDMPEEDPDLLMKENPQFVQWMAALRELRVTEGQYVADLETLFNYAQECRLERVMTEQEVFIRCFPGLPDIVRFQRSFQVELEKELNDLRLSNYQASLDARPEILFTKHEHQFIDLYGPFIRNYKKAELVIVEKEEVLARKVPMISPHVLKLSYLLKPIQRLCKYQVIFKELIKRAPQKRIEGLMQGEQATKRIAQAVNEQVRRAENELADIQLTKQAAGALPPDLKHNLCIYGNLHVASEQEASHESTSLISGSMGFMGYLYESHLIIVKEKPTSTGMAVLGTKQPGIVVKYAIPLVTILSYKSINAVVRNSLQITYAYGHVKPRFITLTLRSKEVHDHWLDSFQSLIRRDTAETRRAGATMGLQLSQEPPQPLSGGHQTSRSVPMLGETPIITRTTGTGVASVPDIADILAETNLSPVKTRQSMSLSGVDDAPFLAKLRTDNQSDALYKWPTTTGRLFVVTGWGKSLLMPVEETRPSLDQIRRLIEARFLRTFIGQLRVRLVIEEFESVSSFVDVDIDCTDAWTQILDMSQDKPFIHLIIFKP